MKNRTCPASAALTAAILLTSTQLVPAQSPAVGALDLSKSQAPSSAAARIQQWLQSPSVFIENQGQWEDGAICFALHSRGVNVGLTAEGVRFQLAAPLSGNGNGTRSEPHVGALPGHRLGNAEGQAPLASGVRRLALSTHFVGARPVRPAGANRSAQVFHYHVGESTRWRENVASWEALVYHGLYPGIDLQVTGKPTGLKYQFRLSPGADWRVVKMRYDGIERLELREDGALVIHLTDDLPPLVDGAPAMYQERNERRMNVAGRFVLLDGRTCGFAVTGEYDPTLPLVIDPEIDWAVFVNSAWLDRANAVALDANGNVFVTGREGSVAFVWKLNGNGGSAGGWVTTLGGSGDDEARSIAWDGAGNVLVAGWTASSGWVSGGYNTNFGGGPYDGFVVKLNASGQHVWSSYLGGPNWDEGYGVSVDQNANVFVTGWTLSPGWVSGGYDTTLNSQDGFLVKLDSAGAHLWSTYLGGSDGDGALGLALDNAGNALVTGYTLSSNWVSGGFDTNYGGGAVVPQDWDAAWGGDAFVVKVGPGGNHVWSTYLGGTNSDVGRSIAVDISNRIYVTGETRSPGWVSGGFDTNWDGGLGRSDAFVAALNYQGLHLWSTYLGYYDAFSTADDSGRGIAVNHSGVYVAGDTDSSFFAPGTFGPRGYTDGFLAKLTSAGAPVWSYYLAGSTNDHALGVAVQPGGNVVVAGVTYSTNFASQAQSSAAQGSGFVLKIKEFGGLRVYLSPPEAVAAGAKWRRVGMTNWLESGSEETNVVAGNYWIEFKPVGGWSPPAPLQAGVLADLTLDYYSQAYIPIPAELSWSSYLGGSAFDSGRGVAMDSAGNALVVGETWSAGWVSGGFDTGHNGGADAFVMKINPAGTAIWSTFLGGAGNDFAQGVTTDSADNVLVAGQTESSGWVSGGYDATYNGGQDGFVTKLAPGGTHLWSTYLGGTTNDSATAIAVDGGDNVLVSGVTRSSGWASGGYDTTKEGLTDGFVVKLSATGAHLWSTYLGGTYNEAALSLGVDGASNIVVGGWTESEGWVSGGIDTTFNGGAYDAFVAKLSPSGAHLWSTYLGGTNHDQCTGVAVDAGGNLFAAGSTDSRFFNPPGYLDYGLKGDYAAFVVRLGAGGNYSWTRLLGGATNDLACGITLDKAGNLLVAGETASTNWITGGPDTSYAGGTDAFLVKMNPDGVSLWSTYFGDAGYDSARAVAVDPFGNILVTGETSSPGWVSGGLYTSYNGQTDAFVVRLHPFVGGLRVVLTPEAAVSGGAQWRAVRDSYPSYSSPWQASGAVLAALPVGEYTIEFADLAAWNPPANQAVLVRDLETNEVAFAYTSPLSLLSWAKCITSGTGDTADGMAIDREGNLFITGTTFSGGWASGGWDTTFNGDYDAFVMKLDSAGNHVWSSFLGGTNGESGYGVATDAAGNVLVTGQTYSGGWISGGYRTVYAGGQDGFAVSLSPAGAHRWSTYLGGTNRDGGRAICSDVNTNVIVVGLTSSGNWISGGYDPTYAGGFDSYGTPIPDAFVVKLDASGQHLWSTYLGGTNTEVANAVAADPGGNVLLAGTTLSPGWTSNGYDTIFNGVGDAFIVKLSPAGALLWSGYLGGTNYDEAEGVAVDSTGCVVVAGTTQSPDWISGGFDLTLGGGRDAFVAKLAPDGSPVWSTYAGGQGLDYGYAVAVDANGSILLTGETSNWQFPGWVNGGFDLTFGYSSFGWDTSDAFVVKLGADGSHRWSTFLGGDNDEEGRAIVSDGRGNILVAGQCNSTLWGSPLRPFYVTNSTGGSGAFVVKLKDLDWPTGPIWMRQISLSVAGLVNLMVEAPGLSASDLVLESCPALTDPPVWSGESGAVLSDLSPGKIQVSIPSLGSRRFYRMHKP